MKAKKSSRFRVAVQRPRTFPVPTVKQANRQQVPWRRYSNSSRPGRPGRGSCSSRLRESACIPVFSSMHRIGSPAGALDVESDNPAHLLLIVRISTVAPTPNSVWLEISGIQDPLHLSRADLVHQPFRHQRVPQRLERPRAAMESEVSGGVSCSRNHLVAFQRRDERRTPRSLPIAQTVTRASRNRLTHSLTRSRQVPNRRAMEETDTSEAASNTMRARRYSLASPRWCRVICSSCCRSVRDRCRAMPHTPTSAGPWWQGPITCIRTFGVLH